MHPEFWHGITCYHLQLRWFVPKGMIKGEIRNTLSHGQKENFVQTDSKHLLIPAAINDIKTSHVHQPFKFV